MATLATTLSDYSWREQGDSRLRAQRASFKRCDRDSFRRSRADV